MSGAKSKCSISFIFLVVIATIWFANENISVDKIRDSFLNEWTHMLKNLNTSFFQTVVHRTWEISPEGDDYIM